MEMHKTKKISFKTCIKMINISAKTFAENCIHTVNVI